MQEQKKRKTTADLVTDMVWGQPIFATPIKVKKIDVDAALARFGDALLEIASVGPVRDETQMQKEIRLARLRLSSKSEWVKGSLIEHRGVGAAACDAVCLVGGFLYADTAWSRWMSDEGYIDENGEADDAEDKFATCDTGKVLLAAINELYGERNWDYAEDDFGNLIDDGHGGAVKKFGFDAPHEFNDHLDTTHEEVLAALDRAYELAAMKKDA